MAEGEYCRRSLGDEKAWGGPRVKEKGPRERTFKVHHLRLEIALDMERRRVVGRSSLSLSPVNDGLQSVELDAVEMTIWRVVADGGQELPFDYAGGKILVHLPRPFAAAEKFTLGVDYETKPRKGVFFIAPDEAHPNKPTMVWSQGESEDSRWWFPSYDASNERMTSEVLLTVPARFVGLANGRLAKVTEDDAKGTKTYHWVMDVPHVNYLVSVAAGEFEVEEESAEGVPLQYYVPRGLKDFIPRTFGNTPDMIRFFGQTTGKPYPYAKYAQVCVEDFIVGGMENISMTTLLRETLHPDAAEPDYRSEPLIAHELAHQWFGDLITCKSWGHLWLNEGFASYFDPLWVEHKLGRDEFHRRMMDEAERYFDEDRDRYRRPIVAHNYIEADDMFDAQTYEKGAWVLHMLRYVLGDELFLKAIRHYVAKFQVGIVETNDFKEAIEEATGKSVDWFFNQWLHHGGHPEYEVSWEWDEARRMVALTVAQRQAVTEVTPLFRMPVEVELLGEEAGRRVVQVEEAEETFYLPASRRPGAVLFDPQGWILKGVKFKKDRGELLHQLTGSTTLPMKAQACEGLGKAVGDDEAVAALAKALREEPFWGVRRAAAKALGAMGTPEARKVLIQELKAQRDSRVRRAIADALGEFKGTEAFEALTTAFPSEVKDYPAAAMAKAAAKTKTPKAFEWVTGDPLGRDSHTEVVRRAALDGLAELRDPRGIAICERYTRQGTDTWLRSTAVDALGRLGEALEDHRPEIREILLPILKDPEYRVRRATVDALGKMKDPDTIPALEGMEEGDIIGFVRVTARSSIRQIRKAQAGKAQRADLDKALGDLRDENRELRARLARVEAQLGGLAKGKGGTKKGRGKRSTEGTPGPASPPGA